MFTIKLINAGVKNADKLPSADHYIDCRGIKNPVHASDCPSGTGDDPGVQAWVKKNSAGQANLFMEEIISAIPQLPTRRSEMKDPYSKPYTVCFLCAHGIHRSRSMKHIIAKKLQGMTSIGGMDFQIEVV